MLYFGVELYIKERIYDIVSSGYIIIGYIMIVYLIRHGQTDSNLRGCLTGRKINSSLTNYGIRQVKTLGSRLKNIHFKYVKYSPLLRAEETAKILCTFITYDECIIDEHLIERDFGVFEGLNKHELWRKKKDYGILDGELSNYFPNNIGGVESNKDTYLRVMKTIKCDLDVFEKEDNIAYITHAGVIHSLITVALSIPENCVKPFKIREASYAVCNIENDQIITLYGLWNND